MMESNNFNSFGKTKNILGAGFDYLDSPVQRVSAWDIPLPYAANLEFMSLPQVPDIIKACKRTLYGAKL
jgi:pyruvate dehydrogenase E1 component beta subunit